jgi:tetratricopeptide (TPR) repeat protein
MVSQMLGGKVHGLPIQVHVMAEDGESIYAQAVRMRRVTRTRDASSPGVVLIYSGHNDPVKLGVPDVPPWLDRFERKWFGRSLFVREGIHAGRRLLRRPPAAHLSGYEFYLRTLVKDCQSAGLLPIVSSVAGNLSGVEPNVWKQPTISGDVHASLAARVFSTLQRLSSLEGEGCENAVDAAARILVDIPEIPPLMIYLKARCLHSLRRLPEALDAYWQALEQDPRTHFGRATRSQNAVVKAVALAAGVPFVDSVQRFAAASPDGVMGSTLFSDAHHPNLDGYLLIAKGFAEAIAGAVGSEILERFEDGRAYAAQYPLEGKASDPALWGGSFLLATAAFHPWPRNRLRLAASNYRQATRDEPGSFAAWAGLGLSIAGQQGLLMNPEAVDRLGRWQVFFSRRMDVPPEDLKELLDLLSAHGVDSSIQSAVRATHPFSRR